MHDDQLRHLDVLPELLAPLPSLPEPEIPPLGSSSTMSAPVHTPVNIFGLYRHYVGGAKYPGHDPEQELGPASFSNIPQPTDGGLMSYGPYPNLTAFRLGEWYWNGGTQKSHASFRKLVKIIGSEDYNPEEIRRVNWDQIDTTLGINDWDSKEWEDEDAGWQRSSVRISVPFHRYTPKPGVRDYAIHNFYHRSLISVIREKLTKTSDMRHFHLEPYQLLWHHSGDSNAPAAGVRLQGELYTSPAFIKAHEDLQKLPGEPGCKLPRVVVALMFWSDGTQLSTYGNGKLTPLYLFFGNESKYRRCKPSLHLCEHVAYFEPV